MAYILTGVRGNDDDDNIFQFIVDPRVYKDAPNVTVISSGPEPARKVEIRTFNFPDVGKFR